MIICLHDHDPFIIDFSKYITHLNIPNICLSLEDLMDKVIIREIQYSKYEKNQAHWLVPSK